jgi:hypothetical protein
MSAFACCRVSGSSIRPLPTARADSTQLPWALRVTPPTAVLPPSGLKLRRRGSGRDADPTHEQQNRRRPTTAGDPRSPTPSPSVEVLPHGDEERAEDRTERHRHPRRPPPRPVARRWHENIAELGATLTEDPTPSTPSSPHPTARARPYSGTTPPPTPTTSARSSAAPSAAIGTTYDSNGSSAVTSLLSCRSRHCARTASRSVGRRDANRAHDPVSPDEHEDRQGTGRPRSRARASMRPVRRRRCRCSARRRSSGRLTRSSMCPSVFR